MELDSDKNSRTDDILNTPGPKKPPVIQKHSRNPIAVTSVSKFSTPVRTQAVKLGNSVSTLTNVIKNNSGSGGGCGVATTTPVLLNSKNILPKSPQILNNSIKLTQKVTGGNGHTTTNLSAKTAVRTSNGQIIYIQKTPPTSNMKTTTSATTAATAAAATTTKTQNVAVSNTKPMTIQVLRTADGSYVPLKTTSTTSAAGTNVKTTLTLSPTTLAGKKIITSSGGQVIIKGTIKPTDSFVTTTTTTTSSAKTVTTNAIAGVRTMVKPLTTGQPNDGHHKLKPIIVHGTGGKQIIVSNQNIVKLSPKPATITTTAGSGGNSITTSSTATSGQIHAIQIPGKIGVQYVRVLPNTKVTAKSLNSTATTAVTSTAASGSTKTLVSSGGQSVKILNTLPQKFTVVQKSGGVGSGSGVTAKLVLTQKKDADYSPTTSKMQKTIVTVPTIKSLNDDKNKTQLQQQQHPQLMKTTTAQSNNLPPNNCIENQTVFRKHKISEINSEIQRITTTSVAAADSGGPPDVKKPTPNNRVVLVSNNSSQAKILNNSIQQPGRITTSIPTNTAGTNNKSITGSMMQVVNVTQNGKKLYTVLKQPTVEHKPNNEMFSVLKTSHQMTATTSTMATTSGKTVVKPLIYKQQVIQQQQQQQHQQKLYQIKQQQQQPQYVVTAGNHNTNAASTTYLLPIKIKEEPDESQITQANINCNSNTEPGQMNMLNFPTIVEEECSETLDNLVGGVRRKHCNCSKSQCLKLYCDCFANGEFCQDCTCKDCFNNLENEDERQRAIKACLERNPNAFKPKITSSRDQSDMRLHNKGCNCKRSGCLKNYCECFEAKIPCSSNCKCVGCRNVEDRPDLDLDPIDPKVLAAIGGGGGGGGVAIDKRSSYEKTQRDFGGSGSGISIKTEKFAKEPIKSLNCYETLGSGAAATSPTLEGQQCNFITQEVIDATIQCMITQADECEKNSLPAYQTEKMVMEELGRCLVEIIDFSIRNTDNSYTQD